MAVEGGVLDARLLYVGSMTPITGTPVGLSIDAQLGAAYVLFRAGNQACSVMLAAPGMQIPGWFRPIGSGFFQGMPVLLAEVGRPPAH